ncbi:hypothetical protein AEP_01643 [Curvibacter sp. AEP1-3]|nr:hypothetical protein AEP_01643 [Curvibacter sp. AEP1-3]
MQASPSPKESAQQEREKKISAALKKVAPQKREAELRALLRSYGKDADVQLTASQAYWVDPLDLAKERAHYAELRNLLIKLAGRHIKNQGDREVWAQEMLTRLAAGEATWLAEDWYPMEWKVRKLASPVTADLAKFWNGQDKGDRDVVRDYFDALERELLKLCGGEVPQGALLNDEAQDCDACCLLMLMAVERFHDDQLELRREKDKGLDRDQTPRAWVIRFLEPFSYRIRRVFANDVVEEQDRGRTAELQLWSSMPTAVSLLLDALKKQALQELPGVSLGRMADTPEARGQNVEDPAEVTLEVEAHVPLGASDTFLRVKSLLGLVSQVIVEMDNKPVGPDRIVLTERHKKVWQQWLAIRYVLEVDGKEGRLPEGWLDRALLSAKKLEPLNVAVRQSDHYALTVDDFAELVGISENTIRRLTDEAYGYVKAHPLFDEIVLHFVPTKLTPSSPGLPPQAPDRLLTTVRTALHSKNGKQMFRDALHVWGVDKGLVT